LTGRCGTAQVEFMFGFGISGNIKFVMVGTYFICGQKANKILYLLSKTFTKTTMAVAAMLIKSYVRPVLQFVMEYGLLI
jgi:hypothetical protein